MVRKFFSVFSYVAAVICIAVAVLPVLAQAGGGFFFRCEGHSMEPTIHQGDVLLVRPLEQPAKPGNIVVARFEDNGRNDNLYVHRVNKEEGDGRILLKGDNNANPDPSPIKRTQVAGTPHFRMTGGVAKVFLWGNSIVGRIVLAIATILFLIAPTFLPFRRNPDEDDEQECESLESIGLS